MAVTHKIKLNKNKKNGTFRNMKHKKHSYRTRKTLKKRNKKTGGNKSPTKKAYKSTKEPKPNKRLIKEQKLKVLKQKLDKPEKSLDRAFIKFSLEDVEKLNTNELAQLYQKWRDKERDERKTLRLKDTFKETPIYKEIPTGEYSDIHYEGEPFNMYNPPNKIKQSLEETQNWIDEVPVKPPRQSRPPKRTITNEWIPSNIELSNQEYDINNPPSQMKQDLEQFSDEFDENNTGMREPEYNMLEADEDLELLDIDEE